MTTVLLKSPDFYRTAAEDIAQGRDTDAAASLMADLRAELAAGQLVKNVEKALKARGGGQWSAAAVGVANTRNWRQILEDASRELEKGQTETTNQTKARNLVDAMLSEDPRVATLGPKLEKVGASKALADYLAGHRATRKSQISASLLTLAMGLAAAAFGFYLIATANPAGPDKPHPGMLLMAILGLGAAGKGISGLWRK